MRSIERRFKNIAEKYPFWSSLTCFRRAIEGQGFKKRTLYLQFNKLVEKDDYDQKEKRNILHDLVNPKPP
ncbi:MAG: hypothetical protein Q8K92_08760 [Leadbetterella sp.]|nr:hypothetical protein [Leadbetterella sp.]